MAKKKKAVKVVKRPPLVTFKVDAAEKKALVAKAKKYCHGNISRWLRLAGLHFVPSQRQLADD